VYDAQGNWAYSNILPITVIGPTLIPDFVGEPTEGAAGLRVVFTDTTKGGTPNSWIWFFFDGTGEHPTTLPVIEHTFVEPGEYHVSMLVYDEENALWLPVVKRNYITVGASPKASFTHSSTEGQVPLTVRFTDTSVGPGIDTWYWDFGNGKTSSERHPETTYNVPGEYRVILTVSSKYGQDTTEPQILSIRETSGPVIASFSADPTIGYAPLWVQFRDISTGGPEQWEWNFGDNSELSHDQNPLHLFEKAGTYRVTLTASKNNGNPTQASAMIRATQDGLPEIEFNTEKYVGTVPLTVCFTDMTDLQFKATTWLWDFGDRNSSFQQNPCHTYREPGMYTVTLEAKNAQGVGQKIRVVYVVVTE
jgi:PKD repeat protein